MMLPGSTRTALITGGTDGLGQALACAYLRAGWRVVVLGRVDRRGTDDAAAIFLQVDLLSRSGLESVEPALVLAGVETIHCLIHNAASGWVGDVGTQTAKSIDTIVALNVWAPLALTRLLLPLVERAKGRIVFIGSIAAFAPAPSYAVYAATKAAVDGFARSFAKEMIGRVAVQVIHPGPIRTAFHARAGATAIDPRRFPSPERVALRVLRASGRRAWRSYPDLMTAIVARGSSLARGLVDRIVDRRAGRVSDPLHSAIAEAAPHATRVALVTGSGSGLGAAIVGKLLAAGYRVLGVDVVPTDPPGTTDRFWPIEASIATSEGIDHIATVAAEEEKIDLLVHCAGISDIGPFETRSLDRLDQVVKTNLTGPMQLTARMLRDGHLSAAARMVFISSLSHFVGYPGAAVYAASKDGLAHYARCVGVALRSNGRYCLTVFPGPMRTPHAERYAPVGADDRNRVDPHAVARKIFSAIARRSARLVVGRGARLAMVVGLFAPGFATDIMRRTLFERLRSVTPAPGKSVH
ncbi:MAG: SDR family NAD(P)-dependent oxidoreductase [Burkholderiales bacterium]